MKKGKKKTGSLIRAIALIVFSAALIYALIVFRGDFAFRTPAHEQTEPLAPPGQVLRPDIDLIIQWATEDQLDRETINQRLGKEFELLILMQDINASGHPNILLLAADGLWPRLNRTLTESGYTHAFHELLLYEVRGKKAVPLLHIDSGAIRNHRGETLIGQVPATNGYGILLQPYEHPSLYGRPVILLEVIMLDTEGRGGSDDIVIYWNPTDSEYRATNIFGAP